MSIARRGHLRGLKCRTTIFGWGIFARTPLGELTAHPRAPSGERESYCPSPRILRHYRCVPGVCIFLGHLSSHVALRDGFIMTAAAASTTIVI